MYQNKRILAIIPARGGSKGIPGKNIIPLYGRPLLAYSIIAAQQSRYIDNIFVSTDSEDIRKVAEDYGISVPFLRPAALASDTARTIDCMLHVIQTLSGQGEHYDYVILLQPTQPIRKPEWIDEALEQLAACPQADSLVSVCPVTEHPILMRTITKEGTLQSLLSRSSTIRRQDFPDVYRVNGSIYINRINDNFNATTSLNDNIMPYIMDEQYSIDIDSYEDLEKAKKLVSDFFI